MRSASTRGQADANERGGVLNRKLPARPTERLRKRNGKVRLAGTFPKKPPAAESPTERMFFFHIHLPVADSAVMGANDFAHALGAGAKDLMTQEAANVDSSFISSHFQINQTISGMEQCWTIKAVVAGKIRLAAVEYKAAERFPHGPSYRGDLFLCLRAGNGPAIHAGVPALEQ